MTFAYQDWQAGKRPPKGFDVADCVENGWTREDVTVMMRAAVCDELPPFPGTSYSFADWQAGKPHPKDFDIADRIAYGWTKEQVQAMRKQLVCDELPDWTDDVDPTDSYRAVDHSKSAKGATMRAEFPANGEAMADEPAALPSAKPGWETELIEVDGKVRLDAIHNWMLVIENHPETLGVFAYDTFRHNVMLMRCPPWEVPAGWVPRPIEPQDRVHLVMWLERRHFKAKPTNIDPVILAVAQRNSFDPLVDYLTSLRWDGVSRARHWMAKYLGADDNDYASAIGNRFLISAVARGLRPGSKVDTMPILEGPQGLKKSSAIEALFSKDFFTDHLSGIGSKDALMEMQGVWAIEVAEMDQFSRAETGQIKKFLSQKVDRYRPPYGRDVINAPRRCVLVGSINPDGSGYLRDPTGARRFWPVTCRRIDVEAIHVDRDQLWAEAVHAFNAGEPWWVQENEIASVTAEQAGRTDTDPWADVLDYALKGAVEVGQPEVFKILGLETRDMGRVHTDRAIRVMLSLGWTKIRDQRNGGSQTLFLRAGIDPVDPSNW